MAARVAQYRSQGIFHHTHPVIKQPKSVYVREEAIFLLPHNFSFLQNQFRVSGYTKFQLKGIPQD
jgi:hypothetical protein